MEQVPYSRLGLRHLLLRNFLHHGSSFRFKAAQEAEILARQFDELRAPEHLRRSP
jgi:hypothetical protein